ncbi:hypothetical protein QFC19_000450 [Naganishia cerealis]|uniref:Uncharacterized protein n=1 Tax=Naganishia cerealis TaxID=610337 RepID=A0ACC2WNI7_9TREE|nr:hypothetical protein QFC19_000450 [Naganishia cerealis]
MTLHSSSKGIGTYQDIQGVQWQSGSDLEVGSHPGTSNYLYPFAPLPYEAKHPTSRMASGSISYTSTMAMDPVTYLLHTRMPVAERDTVPGQFRLQLTRMPWTKRIPTHRDYTRPRACFDSPLETGSVAESPCLLTVNLHQYLANVNQPTRPLRSFTLASMLTTPLERMAMSYFETQGCGEIIATREMKSNWIYAQMLPRVYELLAGDNEGSGVLPDRAKGLNEGVGKNTSATNTLIMESAGRGSHQLIKEYVYHTLVRLSCVHRANTESDPVRVEALRREVRAHEKRAMRAGFTARIYFLQEEWKTEEYL